MDLTKTGRFKRVGGDASKPLTRTSNPGLLLRRRSGAINRIRVRGREMRIGYGLGNAARAVAANLPIARIVAVMGVLLVISIGILLGVNAYARSKQISVSIDNGIITVNTITTARTVGELLSQNDVALSPNDEVDPPMNSRLRSGMAIVIDKAMIVFITSHGEMRQVYMTGGTVQDALTKAQIQYDQDDEISPAPTTKLRAGMRIKHVAVESVIISEMQKIPHETYYQDSDNVLRGRYVVSQRGSDGVAKRDIKVTYKDGVEVNRVEIGSTIQAEPKDRIILKGTQEPVVVSLSNKSNDSGDDDRKSADDDRSSDDSSSDQSPSKATHKPSGGSGGKSSPTKHDQSPTPNPTPKPTTKPTTKPGNGVYDQVRPEDLKIPPVPSGFESILYMTITAYTHTGQKTAAGTWPQYTRTLKKPGTIAVDPDAIPFGTLLYVTGYGYCVAEDTGANIGDSSRMGDVFMNTDEDCYKWGRKRDIKVYIVQRNFKR